MKLLLVAMGLLLSISAFSADESNPSPQEVREALQYLLEKFSKNYKEPDWIFEAGKKCHIECRNVYDKGVEEAKKTFDIDKLRKLNTAYHECGQKCDKEREDMFMKEWCRAFEVETHFPAPACW